MHQWFFLIFTPAIIRRFLAPYTSSSKIDWSSLILRLGFGVLMIPHGYGKYQNFEKYSERFMDFIGLGGPVSLGLTIFAELVCSVLLIAGLATRAVLIPLIITMLTAAFVAHANDPLDKKEHALMYLIGYLAIFIMGAGKYSVDNFLFRKKVF